MSKKYTLEEILTPNAQQELRQLQNAIKRWRAEKSNLNYTELRNIGLTLEKVVVLLERQDRKQRELEEMFEKARP